MLAICLLCLCACVTSAVEYTFQPPGVSDFFTRPFRKTVKTYYYKTPLQYPHNERIKAPFRRPHTVYVPKPYFVKVPMTQKFFEKHVPYSYKIERPLQQLYFEHKLPLDTKIIQDIRVPFDTQVTVEKPLLVSEVEKPIVEKPQEEPFHLSIPEAPTQFEVKKESAPFPVFDKEFFEQQFNGGSGFKSDLAQGKQQHVSFPSELHQSWSPPSKVVLEPIVVSEEPKKWQNFSSLSEWLPKYEISDVKTLSSEEFNSAIPERQKFELSEVKIPLNESPQELSKHSFASEMSPQFEVKKESAPFPGVDKDFFEQQFNRGSGFSSDLARGKQQYAFPSTENITYQQHVAFFENPQIIQESSSTNKNQLYHISSGQLIKPEALTSSVSFKKINTDEKSSLGSSEKWITGQELYTTQNEAPIKWEKGQEHVLSQNEPNKDWAESQVKYTIHREPTNHYVSNLHQQHKIQYEPSTKLTKTQEEYLAQNEAVKNWLKIHEQYTSQKQPEQQWLKSDVQYVSQKQPTHEWFKTEGQANPQKYGQPQLSVQDIQSSESKPAQQAQSTQHFFMSPQYEIHSKEVVQPQQEKQYYSFPAQFESNFKPLIPVQGQTPYIRPAETNEQSSQNSHTQLQNYVQQTHLQQQQPVQQQQQHHLQHIQPHQHVTQQTHQYVTKQPHQYVTQQSHQHVQEQPKSQQHVPLQQNLQNLQYFHDPKSAPLQTQNHPKQEVGALMHGHFSQYEPQQQQNNQEATSHISYQQYFPETQHHQQSQQLLQDFPRPQYPVEPQQFHSTTDKHGYWHHGPQHEAIKEKTMPEGLVSVGSESREQQPTKSMDGEVIGQKSRKLRQPMSVVVTDQHVRLTRVTTTAMTEEPSTTTAPTSTTSHPRRKHRRKHRRRNNQETTTQLPEQ